MASLGFQFHVDPAPCWSAVVSPVDSSHVNPVLCDIAQISEVNKEGKFLCHLIKFSNTRERWFPELYFAIYWFICVYVISFHRLNINRNYVTKKEKIDIHSLPKAPKRPMTSYLEFYKNHYNEIVENNNLQAGMHLQ